MAGRLVSALLDHLMRAARPSTTDCWNHVRDAVREGAAGQLTRAIIDPMYAVVGFEDAGAASPDWESEHEAPTLDAAIEIAQNWIVSHPAGRVDVIQMVGGEGSVVRVVSRHGVESVAKMPPSRRARWRAWSRRPPQVFLKIPIPGWLAAVFFSIWLAVLVTMFGKRWPAASIGLVVLPLVVAGIVGLRRLGRQISAGIRDGSAE